MPTPNNSLSQGITKTLVWAADLIAVDVRKNAKTDRIRKAVRVSTVDSDTQSITISASTKDAPEVLAYEFGSGIWGHAGRKYPIRPVNSKFLAFSWPAATEAAAFSDTGKELVTPGPGGRVILPGVMHPGVRPEPAFEPALRKNEQKIVSKFADMSVKVIADMVVTEKVITV